MYYKKNKSLKTQIKAIPNIKAASIGKKYF